MGTQTPNRAGQPEPTAPGKPASRQPPDANTGTNQDAEEGQEIPKTGRGPVDAIEEDAANAIPTDDDDDDAQDDEDDDQDEDEDEDDDDDDDDEDDDDENGSIELPAEGGDRDRLNGSSAGDNQ
jgi:hypothetical protein